MRIRIMILFASIWIVGCSQTPTQNYIRGIDHYAACDRVHDDVTSVIACGKATRNKYCSENQICSISGNAMVAYLDMLVDQYKREEITTSELRWLYDKKLADIDAEDRRQYAIWQAEKAAAGRRLSNSLMKYGSEIQSRNGGYGSYGGYGSPSQSQGYFSHQDSSVNSRICYYNTNNGKRALNLKSWQSCPSTHIFTD